MQLLVLHGLYLSSHLSTLFPDLPWFAAAQSGRSCTQIALSKIQAAPLRPRLYPPEK